MTALAIVALVLLSMSLVVDIIAAIVSDGDAGPIAVLHMIPTALAIVTIGVLL